MDYEDIRECVSKVINSLCRDPEVHPFLVKESMVPVLVLFVKTATLSFDFVLYAISLMTRYHIFHDDLVKKGVICAIVGAIVSGKVMKREQADECCRIFCLISHTGGTASNLVHSEHLLIGLHVLFSRKLCSVQAIDMIIATLCSLSYTPSVRKYLVTQDCFKLSKKLIAEPTGIKSNRMRSGFCAKFIHNLCLDPTLHQSLLEQGLMNILYDITKTALTKTVVDSKYSPAKRIPFINEFEESFGGATGDEVFDDDDELVDVVTESRSPPKKWSFNYKCFQDTLYDIAMSLQLLSALEDCREVICIERGMSILEMMLQDFLNDNAKYEISCAISNLSLSKSCKKLLVEAGAIELLKRLCQSEISEIQEQVANALASLSDTTTVGHGTVAALMMLSLKDEAVLTTDDEVRMAAAELHKGRKKPSDTREKSRMEMQYAMATDDEKSSAVTVIEMLRARSSQFSSGSQLVTLPRSVADAYRDFCNYLKERNRQLVATLQLPGEHTDLVVSLDLEPILFPPFNEIYSYTIIPAKLQVENGGMAQKVPIDLPFPGMSGAEGLDSVPNRMAELQDVPVTPKPLAKQLGFADISDKEEDKNSIVAMFPHSKDPIDKQSPKPEKYNSSISHESIAQKSPFLLSSTGSIKETNRPFSPLSSPTGGRSNVRQLVK